MDKLKIDLGSSVSEADAISIVTQLAADADFAGKRGEACALAASNLVGAWNKCIAMLAGTGADAGAPMGGTVLTLLDPNGVDAFSVRDEEAAKACANGASKVLSRIFASPQLARLLANYARGNDAEAGGDTAATVGLFTAAYEKLTAALATPAAAATTATL
jgi:hypothetical protein